ncbi:hypothetical protein GCM10027170_28730 [Aliiglaciecola aliphaticivorans]
MLRHGILRDKPPRSMVFRPWGCYAMGCYAMGFYAMVFGHIPSGLKPPTTGLPKWIYTPL